jgi:metallo-beta-lactamase class B
MNDEIRRLLQDGHKIEAIKRVRQQTGAGLKDAKDYVEAVSRGENPPQPLPAPARTGGLGCATVFAFVIVALAALLWVMGARAQGIDNQPVEPFRIAGNLYYVGASDISAYLIATPAGHVVIDAGYESTVPQIEKNIRTLGFKVEDVRILLNTQAHYDHAAGFAALKKDTGAKLMASDADADVIERGGLRDFSFGDSHPFPAAKVDRRLKDGDTVTLGKLTLHAHVTPGHTRGCTTWAFSVTESNRELHVVDMCGLTVLDTTRLLNNAGYPEIVSDYERTFTAMRAIPVDIFIGAHPSYYGGAEKAARLRANPSGPNPFIDADGYQRYIDTGEKRFREALAKAKAR